MRSFAIHICSLLDNLILLFLFLHFTLSQILNSKNNNIRTSSSSSNKLIKTPPQIKILYKFFPLCHIFVFKNNNNIFTFKQISCSFIFTSFNVAATSAVKLSLLLQLFSYIKFSVAIRAVNKSIKLCFMMLYFIIMELKIISFCSF